MAAITLAALKAWAMANDSEGLAGYGRIRIERLGAMDLSINYSSVTINYVIDNNLNKGHESVCESNDHACTIATGEKSSRFFNHDTQVGRLLTSLEKYDFVTFGMLLSEIAYADCPVISEDIWSEAA